MSSCNFYVSRRGNYTLVHRGTDTCIVVQTACSGHHVSQRICLTHGLSTGTKRLPFTSTKVLIRSWFFNTNLSIFFGTCLGSVWRSDQGSFHISSSRVYLLLACQELLKCVWPPMNQRRIADHRKLYRQNNQLPNKMPAELEGKLNILDSFGGGCHLEQLNEAIQGKLKSQTRTFSRI